MNLIARLLLGLAMVLLLAALSVPACAQTRAWLDRDSIAAGETVTLNIETDGVAAPDYTPLEREFIVSGHTSRTEFAINNNRTSTRTLYAVALRPHRDGLLTVPALYVGNARTPPLSLRVTPAAQAAPARPGAAAFIESEPDDSDPYVQQAVGWVVRLYSRTPLISGALDQPAPEGASLQQVGDDAKYTRDIGGTRYSVIERRFLLIPERSGTVTVPGATFEGRGVGGFFDDLFGDGGALHARAAPRFLQVRSAPASAPQPWLPLHDLQLRYQTTPQELRTGSAATLTVELMADGASAAQLPELQLPAIDGVQVFADPVQAEERFNNGRPRVKLARKFSLVPTRTGKASLRGMRIGWWDVQSNRARSATLPPLSWQIAAGAAGDAAAAADLESPSASSKPLAEASGGANRGWVLATLLFASLWLFTLVWALHRRAAMLPPTLPSATPAIPPARKPAELRRALETGDFAEVAELLCAMAQPPARDLDEVIARLEQPAQRDAVAAMQRARWGEGDGVRARQLLRSAFAEGPRWRSEPTGKPSLLPPLYPSG